MCITSSDTLVTRLLVSIIYYQPLFLLSVISERCIQYCNKCTNACNVNFCDYNIMNRFYDTHSY